MNRIERDTGVPHLADILSDRLAPTDLQSLLLEVYARRVKRRDPKALLTITSQTASLSLPPLIPDAFLNGTE